MRCIALLFCLVIVPLISEAQDSLPAIFRYQQKRTEKRVQRVLQHDTLIQTSGANIHLYYANMPGKPYLLLLHGMGIDAKTNWYKQLPYLSRCYNLLLPDLIYFGKSSSKLGDYSVEFQAQQLYEAIKPLIGNQPLHVMGFSYGGLVAAMFNERYHETVNKLIIIDGPVKYFSVETADSLAKTQGANNMTAIIVPQNIGDFNAMQKAVISRRMLVSRKLKTNIIRYYFKPTVAERTAQLNYLAQHQTVYQSNNYNLNNTPTLLIWVAKDGVVPLAVGEHLHEQFPTTSRLIVFKKAKHDAHFRCARALNRAVVKFLANTP